VLFVLMVVQPCLSFRRLSKEYENTIESSEAMIKIANIRRMLRKLAPALYVL
jgi:hypothetical protein